MKRIAFVLLVALIVCTTMTMCVSCAKAEENKITVIGPDGTEVISTLYYSITKGGEYTISQSNTEEQLVFRISVNASDAPVTIKLAGLNIKAGDSSTNEYDALSISGTQPVTIVLIDDTTNKLSGYGKAGIHVGTRADVSIEGNGTLYANGSSYTSYSGYSHSYYYSPGIYKGNGDNTLTINGGTIYANGAYLCAGIGGGYTSYPGAYGGSSSYSAGNASNITISGGTIYAQGRGGAGIGGSRHGNASGIIITGGNIHASGYKTGSGDRFYGNGIGSGDGGGTSSITIAPGKNTIIFAKSGNTSKFLWEETITNSTDVSFLVKGHSVFESDSQKQPCLHTGETEVRGAVEPTYDSEGYTGDTYCLDCDEIISQGSSIPKLYDLPETGDKSNIYLWCALIILSFGVLCFMNKRFV